MALETTEARSGAPSPLILSPVIERGLLESGAHVVSQIGSPPVLAAAAAFLAAGLERNAAAFGFAALHTLLMVLVPVAYLLLQIRRGRVSDLEIFRREERWRPYLATIAGAWLAWSAIRFGGGPARLSGVAGVLALEAALVFAVTLGWKISLHCATAAAAGALVWKLVGTPLPLLVGSPLMIWSRLLLRRHTPAQTIAGSIAGILVVLVFFDFFAGRN
jgi:membrane-associated phospholipid phosphatase